MTQIKNFNSWLKRLFLVGLCLLVAASLFNSREASAKSLDNPAFVVSSGLPSAIVSQDFSFFVPSLPDIGSIVFEYCISPIFDEPCISPNSIDVSGANLTSQSGNTGFTIDSTHTTANKLVLSRPIAASAVIQSSYSFTNIVNPSSSGTVYIRIATYGTTDGSGSFIDNGAVAYAVNSAFAVGAYVPPFLQACAGLTVAPDCSSASGTIANLGDLSATHANTATSQFAVATNSPTGLAVYGLGSTMTSGNNQIDPLSNNAFSASGTRQFGINLRANVLPLVGADPTGPGTTSPTGPYNAIDQFRFVSGEMLAQSPIPTDYRTFTVSYLANISSDIPVGIYATSLTYLVVAQF